MKVLTVLENLGIGGTQRVAQNLSLGLSALGAEVAVLGYLGRGPREEAYRAGGVAVFAPAPDEVRPGNVRPGHIAGLDDQVLEPSEAAIEAARRWSPDIIHFHRDGYANPEETRILRHLRSDGAKTVETNVFGRFDWSEGGSLIDAHCLLSKWCAFKWNAWGGRSARLKRSYILPNAVDTKSIVPISDAHRQSVRASLGIPPERFVFGRVGQPFIPKWSLATFEIFQKTLRQHDIGLLLVGAPMEIVQRLGSLPDDVRSRIIVVPPTASDERLSSLIGAMDGFLHMSAIGESFGMVLCEAMLSGVPVVTLSTPLKDNSQLEVVGHEKGGLIALTMDAVPIAMTRLIEDKQLRDAVRTGGHAWVASRFGVDVVSRKAMDVYQSLLSGAPMTRRSGTDDPDAPPDREWIRSMLSNGIGQGPDTRTSLVFELLHNPYIYRAYVAAKSWK
jgi:glycosyltransferase involved in cell wall biosynthesis